MVTGGSQSSVAQKALRENQASNWSRAGAQSQPLVTSLTAFTPALGSHCCSAEESINPDPMPSLLLPLRAISILVIKANPPGDSRLIEAVGGNHEFIRRKSARGK
jgi:hypothetical protein